MSGDPQQEYFSDGITEDITTDLSKISSLFVIARNSAFTYKGKSVKVQDVSKEMGVRYVLEGSVRKADNQVRVTAQLIDATTGGHLWSERYDRPLTNIFALQDEIRHKIVLALKVKLTPEEQERFRSVPTNNLEAYDYLLRGREAYFHAWHEHRKEANVQARQLYEKAIELDPQYAAAYARLVLSYWIDFFFLWDKDSAQSLEQAFALAQRAVALDDSLSVAHRVLGATYLFKRQHAQAIAEIERAITLDPSDAIGYLELGTTLVFAGRAEEGIGLMEQGMRLDPRNPAFYLVATTLFRPLFRGCKRRSFLACCGDDTRRSSEPASLASSPALVNRHGPPVARGRLRAGNPSRAPMGGHVSVGGARGGSGAALRPALCACHGAGTSARRDAGAVGGGITQARTALCGGTDL